MKLQFFIKIYMNLLLIWLQAAGRHQCSYLINLQKSEFLHQGGDPSWLRGLKSIPSKLNDLYEINKILAHRPWLLNETHIAVSIFITLQFKKLKNFCKSYLLINPIKEIVLQVLASTINTFAMYVTLNQHITIFFNFYKLFRFYFCLNIKYYEIKSKNRLPFLSFSYEEISKFTYKSNIFI